MLGLELVNYSVIVGFIDMIMYSCGELHWLQAIYSEAVAMVEEYHQAFSAPNIGGIGDTGGLYPQLGLMNSPEVLICYAENLF